MEKKMFLATVQIAIVAENQAEACDGISGLLSETGMMSGAINDWQYSSGKEEPKEIPYDFNEEYEEGEVFNGHNSQIQLMKETLNRVSNSLAEDILHYEDVKDEDALESCVELQEHVRRALGHID